MISLVFLSIKINAGLARLGEVETCAKSFAIEIGLVTVDAKLAPLVNKTAALVTRINGRKRRFCNVALTQIQRSGY